MGKSTDSLFRKLSVNRSALRDYTVLNRLEAGIELVGTEVKSVKSANISLRGSYAKIINGEMFLLNLNIPSYEYGNRFNHDPVRPRRLLLHKKEILKMQMAVEQKGQTIVPLSIYDKRGKIKIELGVCKGKALYDKRNAVKKKTAERQAERAIRRSVHR